MTAERASTTELLRSSLDDLRTSLAAGGFQSGQLDVGQQSTGRGANDPSGRPAAGSSGAGSAAATSGPEARPRATTVRPSALGSGSRLDLSL